MKLHSIKPKGDHDMGMPISSKAKYYPHFSISLADFPESKDWKVGSEYNISLHVRQSEMEQRKDGDGRVAFEILAIGGEEKKPEPKNYSRMSKK